MNILTVHSTIKKLEFLKMLIYSLLIVWQYTSSFDQYYQSMYIVYKIKCICEYLWDVVERADRNECLGWEDTSSLGLLPSGYLGGFPGRLWWRTPGLYVGWFDDQLRCHISMLASCPIYVVSHRISRRRCVNWWWLTTICGVRHKRVVSRRCKSFTCIREGMLLAITPPKCQGCYSLLHRVL